MHMFLQPVGFAKLNQPSFFPSGKWVEYDCLIAAINKQKPTAVKWKHNVGLSITKTVKIYRKKPIICLFHS